MAEEGRVSWATEAEAVLFLVDPATLLPAVAEEQPAVAEVEAEAQPAVAEVEVEVEAQPAAAEAVAQE